MLTDSLGTMRLSLINVKMVISQTGEGKTLKVTLLACMYKVNLCQHTSTCTDKGCYIL